MAHWLELGFKGIIEANAFMATFTELLFSIYNFYFCYVLQLVDLLQSLPACSADCERGIQSV